MKQKTIARSIIGLTRLVIRSAVKKLENLTWENGDRRFSDIILIIPPLKFL